MARKRSPATRGLKSSKLTPKLVASVPVDRSELGAATVVHAPILSAGVLSFDDAIDITDNGLVRDASLRQRPLRQ